MATSEQEALGRQHAVGRPTSVALLRRSFHSWLSRIGTFDERRAGRARRRAQGDYRWRPFISKLLQELEGVEASLTVTRHVSIQPDSAEDHDDLADALFVGRVARKRV
jgi:hypothetical protein